MRTQVPTTTREMVEWQLAGRGLSAARVLDAMVRVPRERFVPDALRGQALADRALAVGYDQTISQPYIVGLMAAAAQLAPTDRVLEVGTGTGYSAAVASLLAREVYSIERIPELADSARERLAELRFDRIHLRCGDGALGWAEHAPYDAIIVTACGPALPRALIDQLAIGGRMVMPVGARDDQRLICVTKQPDGTLRTDHYGRVVFVPLVSDAR